MKRKTILSVIMVSILLLSVVAVTYAYFQGDVNNVNQQTATVTAGTMELTFADNDDGIGAVMNFGDTITKKFTIENTGTVDAFATIEWKNLLNTYLEGSLQYDLEYSVQENGTYTQIIMDKNVPRSETASTIELADNLLIPAGTKRYYNLHITLVYSETVDQTSDLNATFNTEFNLKSLYNNNNTKVNYTLSKLKDTPKDLKPTFEVSSELEEYLYKNGEITPYCATTNVGVESMLENGPIEETCKRLYCITNIGCYDSTIEDLYVGNAVWDNTENKCLFNDNEVMSIATETFATKEECGKVFNDGDIYITGFNEETGRWTTGADGPGLYSTEDDYGTSYYYRGNVTNNYVKFANYYWRIVRINGDGTLRIIYDGTRVHENGVTSDDRILFNTSYNNLYSDNGYLGYMYGNFIENTCSEYDSEIFANYEQNCKNGSISYENAHENINDSNIKKELDNWYKENLSIEQYSNYISDNIFCNDRTIYEGKGSGYSNTFYNSFIRYYLASPNLKCKQKNDRFTVNDTLNGNGDLTYPIGLITIDELIFAGVAGIDVFDKYPSYSSTTKLENFNAYIYKNIEYFTMSPSVFNEPTSTDFGAYIITYSKNVSFLGSHLDNKRGVVPVINLNFNFIQDMIGDGTPTDPYRVE